MSLSQAQLAARDGQLRERFMAFVSPEPMSGCWLWMGAYDPDGYGYIGFARKVYRANRLSWMIHRGDIPAGLGALHTCDNPCCVNPDHLFLGTPKQNAIDRTQKGRGARNFGAANGKSVLDEAMVRAIRGDIRTHREIAATFGISKSLVGAVRRGEVWPLC